jgi:hypothetical protein
MEINITDNGSNARAMDKFSAITKEKQPRKTQLL